jgi:succinate dehydrogenase / fumarate reductase membrane anchor subunit
MGLGMVKNPFFNIFGGMTQWLYQRFSALVLYFFVAYLLYHWLQIEEVSYASWTLFFGNFLNRFTVVFLFLVTFFHAWIGVQHVIEDYIKNPLLNRLVYYLLLFSMILQIIFLFLFLIGIKFYAAF